MLRSTLGLRESYELVISKVKEVVGKDLVGILIFGSTIYLGSGEDVDLVVIISSELSLKDRFKVEYRVKKELERLFKSLIFDVHILSIEEFRNNLKPGSFLSGLALGYEVIYGKLVLEPLILDFLNELSKEKYILHNKYGTWNLSHHAKVLYKIKSKHKDP